MRLEIKDFAKVKSADINIDGITVIAGDNNTGKSTVGKVLFSVFNSVSNIAEKVEESRKREIISNCRSAVREIIMKQHKGLDSNNRLITFRSVELISNRVIKELLNNDKSMSDGVSLENIFIKLSDESKLAIDKSVEDEINQSIFQIIEKVNKTEDYAIAIEIINILFNRVFFNQINNLEDDNLAEIKLHIKDKQMKFAFSDNMCNEWKTNVDIMHEAFFLDDPFVLDKINTNYYEDNFMRDFLIDKIKKADKDADENIINAIWTKEKLTEIFDILNKVVPDEIEENNGNWELTSDKYSILLSNLSAGLKTFVLLKLMLEKSLLKEKDVLILDEPEIHLHPEWQIKYAELIVLLQKKFDLSLIVTTHSRDFLEAVELYAKKYDIIEKCNFYLSRQVEGGIEFDNISKDLSEIYRHLITPGRLLDKLKFEMEETDDE